MTSRRLRKVGLGIPLLQQAVQSCMGDLEIQSKKGIGTKVKATFQHSHIDRMPIGDMAATLTAAIAAKPDLNLSYRHLMDDRVFTFDAKVLKNEFKDIPFNDARVLSWIKKYCSAGIKKLYRDDFNLLAIARLTASPCPKPNKPTILPCGVFIRKLLDIHLLPLNIFIHSNANCVYNGLTEKCIEYYSLTINILIELT